MEIQCGVINCKYMYTLNIYIVNDILRVSSTLKEKDDLKCKAGKQLDKTLKDENDRLKSQLSKLDKDNAELRSVVDQLRTR